MVNQHPSSRQVPDEYGPLAAQILLNLATSKGREALNPETRATVMLRADGINRAYDEWEASRRGPEA